MVQVSFKLTAKAKDIMPGAKAALQAKVFLDDIPVLNPNGSTTERTDPKRLIQSRLFEVSCQPKYRPSSSGDVVILTTTSSTASQIDEWRKMVGTLGLESEIYSMSRYGHVSANQEVEDASLAESFQNKVIVFLIHVVAVVVVAMVTGLQQLHQTVRNDR